jgi:predicted dehydrogenase
LTRITNIYDLGELVGAPRFVVISNPTHLHLPAINELVPLGIPLFIEKPPLHTLDGAQQVAGVIKQQNILTYVACNMRFHPCIKFLKKYFTENNRRINEVNVYCGSYLPDWRPGKDYTKIYSANKNMGGGVHLDLFHEMDYTCWLFGYPGESKGILNSKSSLTIDAVDYANYVLDYPGFNTSVILNYYRRTPKRTMEILFEDDTWVIDLINCTITSQAGEAIFKSPDFKITDTYIEQMRYFIDCIDSNSAPMNTFDDAVKVLQISLGNA